MRTQLTPSPATCSHLDIHVQTVVEVPKPEEVSETEGDVKGTELAVAQREQPQDVQVVLVPPTVRMGGGPQGQDSDRQKGKKSLGSEMG